MEDEKDFFYMRMALEEAKKSYTLGEVPIGAVLVKNDIVIASAHNLVEALRDPSAHAEMLCIRKAAQVLGGWRLTDCILYTTVEPCAMCFGVIVLARLKKIVWGASDIRQGACGSWVDLLHANHPIHQIAYQKGILQEESSVLLKSFFKKRRDENDCKKKLGRVVGSAV